MASSLLAHGCFSGISGCFRACGHSAAESFLEGDDGSDDGWGSGADGRLSDSSRGGHKLDPAEDSAAGLADRNPLWLGRPFWAVFDDPVDEQRDEVADEGEADLAVGREESVVPDFCEAGGEDVLEVAPHKLK